jgi:hypothetical protein
VAVVAVHREEVDVVEFSGADDSLQQLELAE